MFHERGTITSDYLHGDRLSKDTHAAFLSALTGIGKWVAAQTCMFRDNAQAPPTFR